MSNLSDLLLDSPQTITVHGKGPLPWWKLGSLCRYESTAYRDASYLPLAVSVTLTHYEIKRKTPKGCWISVYPGQERFILDNARKKWAYPTEELARESFIARKEWQIHHLQRQLEHAQAALAHTQAMTKEPA